MLFTRSIYIGVDPSGGARAIAYAALDYDLGLVALGHGDLEEVLAFVGGQKAAFVAVNAPQRPNQGLLLEQVEQKLLTSKPTRWKDYRLAEYELWQRNIPTYKTPSQGGACKKWMQRGFSLYKRLQTVGYQTYPMKESEKQIMESPTTACYSVWLERPPLPKHGLEGRLQRQLKLFDIGLNIPDPMRFFEEITRHRLLQGNLPADVLYSGGELEALAAAYAAWMALNQPEGVTMLGDVKEGQIVVPVAELKQRY
ncbi:MAG: DUF429 domain-containing protein [Chloroflexi bacterium]|nr:DUF429 domain-containing protein [Chloroflexota bacterium]